MAVRCPRGPGSCQGGARSLLLAGLALVAVADLAGAAHFQVMRGMGHFPMSENPALFKEYLMPVLEKIEAL